ncbi:MAG: hypothetical protein ACREQ5_29215 [Candidatus Dormibacteria bacterium]
MKHFTVGPLLFFLIFTSPWSHAFTIKPDIQTCTMLAGVADQTIRWKDEGQTWDEIKANFSQAVINAQASHNSIIKDAEDEAFMFKIMKIAYNSKVQSAYAAYSVLNTCLHSNKNESPQSPSQSSDKDWI